MKRTKHFGRFLLSIMLIWLPVTPATADGGYFSSRSVAVSADQRAILVKNGNAISMTFSTGYTGEGEDFAWIIPTPVPPSIEDVIEAGGNGERAFKFLAEYTAPEIYTSSGCFPAGTEVLTTGGPRSIETVKPGTEVCAFDMKSEEWTIGSVLKQETYHYEGDMITIQLGQITIRATGNHPFYVVRGDRLASRPSPQQIPEKERRMAGPGRWVEARDLKEGDRLKTKNDADLNITGLSTRDHKSKVYHLEVERYHNFAVHRAGVLVHNGPKAEAKGQAEPASLVTVYGMLTLENYEVSILGTAAASSLMRWLQEHNYRVSPDAQAILEAYVEQNWAFVAVKLKPSEQRHYENEFLPPLTVRYQHMQLIFPLRISSVSTTDSAKITLYIIAESTVSSFNFPTMILDYEDQSNKWLDPEKYLEASIQRTMGDENRGLAVTYRGEVVRSADDQEIVDGLMKSPFPSDRKRYLTRLETRMNPASMTDDISFMLDPLPGEFRVRIQASGGWGSELILVAQDGRTDAVEELLEAGDNLNARDMSGQTALIAAARGGHTEVVQILLEAGADVHVEYDYGGTALTQAAINGHAEIVQILLEAGAEPVSINRGGAALVRASYNGHAETVRILLHAGADVNTRDASGHTALTAASFKGRFDVVQVLLSSGVDVNGAGRNEWTALMYAAAEGHIEIVQALLEAGAGVNARDKYGRTAFFLAQQEGHMQIVEFLTDVGAEK
jgi:ankyrin repeat protein